MCREHLSFFRNERLTGTLTLPDSPGPHPALIVMHSASGGRRDYPFYDHLVTELPPAGFAVFVFDRRGSGESGGDFETADFEALAADGVAAAEMLAGRPDIDPYRIGVYGVSQGAWLAPIVAARRPATACIVVVSGSGISPAQQMDYTAERALRDAGFGDAAVSRALALRGRVNDYYRSRLPRTTVQDELKAARREPWYSRAYLGDDDLVEDVTQDKWYYEMDYDPLDIWKEVTQPTLFIFPDDDRWVPVATSMAAYRSATATLSNVTFTLIPESDHLMGLENESDPRISPAYLATLRDWLKAVLGNNPSIRQLTK